MNPITVFTFIPIRAVVGISIATALIAIPILVLYIIQPRNTSDMAVMTIVTIEITGKRMPPVITSLPNLVSGVPPIMIILFRKDGNTVLNDFGIPENNTTAMLSRKKETPMAVMRADILGAFLMGLYATRSIRKPSKAAPAMARTAATNHGMLNMVMKKKAK